MKAPAVRRAAPPLWLLVLVTMSGTLAMHMFVPALPYSAVELHATVAQTQMTISMYIIGLAVGQLIYGPLSDSLGRRPALIAGLVLYLLAGVTAAVTTSLQMLVAARLVQALGGCAGLALGRAIVRDTSDSQTVVSRLALLNLIMMVGPGLAPILGSVIAAALGWRAIFWVLAGLGLIALASTWVLLPETGQPTGRFSGKIMLTDYKRLFSSTRFVGFAVGGGMATTSIYAFIAAAPFIFVTELHRPLHEVGLYLGLMIAGMSVGNALTGRLIRTVPINVLLLGGNTASVISAVLLVILTASGHANLAAVLVLIFLYTCGLGLTGPSALTKSLSVNPHLTGSAAGLYGFMQMTAGAISTSFVSVGHDPAFSAAVVLLVAVVLAQLAFWVSLRRERIEVR
ncbi:multidrug effflux MFS transporter [Pseudomonas typographi]|uniref:Bcr/CflA family efflux transporter n=1 Tax=Pseudomonas typographi TaxID=2715964 RepID=A0ABR7YY85_9PSED|nr:multidrug effflux MFS transporter [Pseudomonas typographi]MBD1550442.1 multidrug effflux MFS transporter [Pseudomonas typographi]MBD1587881.1 multidrug effflux MFS transporter [Pseudomonas typographi]MBD1598089.1 multidrug effflux MFS transporter [Pseudomonas typographi]